MRMYTPLGTGQSLFSRARVLYQLWQLPAPTSYCCRRRQRIAAIEIVISHWDQERSAKGTNSLGRRYNTWPAMLNDGCCCGCNVTPQVTHLIAYPIALYVLDAISCGPLIEEIGKIDPGSHRKLNTSRQTWINLHQVRLSRAVAPELHQRVTFQVDLTH